MESCAVHVVSHFFVIVKCNLHISFSQVWLVFHGKLSGCVGNPRKVFQERRPSCHLLVDPRVPLIVPQENNRHNRPLVETERGNVAMHVFFAHIFFKSFFADRSVTVKDSWLSKWNSRFAGYGGSQNRKSNGKTAWYQPELPVLSSQKTA